MIQSKSSKEDLYTYLILGCEAISIFIGYGYYHILINKSEIDSTDTFIYHTFCLILILLSFGFLYFVFTFKPRSLVLLRILFASMLLIQFASISFFRAELAPLPSQFRLTLVNNTGTQLVNVRLAGCQDINTGALNVDEKREIIIQIFEGCSVDLISQGDTIHIGQSSTNSVGYKREYMLSSH